MSLGSVLERGMMRYLTRGACEEPGVVYDLLRRMQKRVPVWKRHDVVLCLMLATAAAVCHVLRWDSELYLGLLLVVLCSWTTIRSSAQARSMLDSGMMDELLLTPVGVSRVWAETLLSVCRQMMLPLYVGLACLIYLMATMPRIKPQPPTMVIQLFFVGPTMVAGCALAGGKIALRIITAETVAEATRRGTRFALRAMLKLTAFAIIAILLGAGLFIALRAFWRTVHPVVFILSVIGTVFIPLMAYLLWQQSKTPLKFEPDPKPVPHDAAKADAELLEAMERLRGGREG